MRDIREIAEKVGEARTRYEQANRDSLDGKGNKEVATYWAHELSLLEWVLGGERISYPVVAPREHS